MRFIYPLLIGALLTMSCSLTSYTREQSLAEMPRLVEIERGFNMLVAIFKAFQSSFTAEVAAEIGGSLDLYYIHHDAASVALASGRYEDFRQHLERGMAELKNAERIMKRVLGI